MFSFLQKISLQTRLFLLTVFALLALLIAVISAFRTAQTSAVFAERQTEINVNSAVRELARDARDIGNPPKEFDKDGRLLPHLRDIYSRYNDDFSRTTAIAMRRFENVSAGFCNKNGQPLGFVSANQTAIDEMQIAENICREFLSDDDFSSKKITLENTNFYTASNDDAYALVTLANGKVYKHEFYFGSTYLSQSSRSLRLGAEVVSFKVFDTMGKESTLGIRP